MTPPLQGDQPRTIAIKAVAKANNLDLEILEEPRTPEHLEVSKLGKVPAFRGEDGMKLFECIAIVIYSASSERLESLLFRECPCLILAKTRLLRL